MCLQGFPFGAAGPDIFERIFQSDPMFSQFFGRVSIQPIRISFLVRCFTSFPLPSIRHCIFRLNKLSFCAAYPFLRFSILALLFYNSRKGNIRITTLFIQIPNDSRFASPTQAMANTGRVDHTVIPNTHLCMYRNQ